MPKQLDLHDHPLPRYYSSPISTFPGNRVLAPFNLIQWTTGSNSNEANYTFTATPVGWQSGEWHCDAAKCGLSLRCRVHAIRNAQGTTHL